MLSVAERGETLDAGSGRNDAETLLDFDDRAIMTDNIWGYLWGNGPAWDSAFLIIPWYVYTYRGDLRILADHYERMRLYVDYLTSKAKDGIVDIGLNDWAPFETKTPADITSTGYYYRDARIVALAASLLGNEADALKYASLAAGIKQAFLMRWFMLTMSLVTAIGTAAIFWFGGMLVLNSPQFTIGTIVAFISYISMLYGPLAALTNDMRGKALVATDRPAE